MRYWKQEELSYIAGLFDGEGCISVAKTKPSVKWRRATPSYELNVKITNSYLPIITWLKESYGKGSLYVHPIKLPRNKKMVWD